MYVEDKREFDLALIDQWLQWLQPWTTPPAGCPGSFFAPYDTLYLILGPSFRAHFPTLTQVTVVGLLPSAQIVAHKDAPIPGRRIHIPLRTNHGCWSFSGHHWRRLQVGAGYWMDPTESHGAVNWGETLRLHLVVDVG
jgi:hypothetical protein